MLLRHIHVHAGDPGRLLPGNVQHSRQEPMRVRAISPFAHSRNVFSEKTAAVPDVSPEPPFDP